MQVDVGNDKIHNSYSSIVANKDLQALQESFPDVGDLPKEALTPHRRQDSSWSASRHARRKTSDRGQATPVVTSPRGQSNASSLPQEAGSRPTSHRHHRSSPSYRRQKKRGSLPSVHAQLPPPYPGETPHGGAAIAAAAAAHSPARQRRQSRRHRSHHSRRMADTIRPVSNGRGRPHEADEAMINHRDEKPLNSGGGGGAGGEGSDNKENRKKEAAPAQKPGPRLAQTKIQLGMRLKRWMVISRIGAGSFGETFTAISVDHLLSPLDPELDPLTITSDAKALLEDLPDPEDRQEVCIKVEQENKNVLRLEAMALKKVQPCPQVVRYLGSGCTSGMNFLVMEKLGPNLAELRRRSLHGTFNIYTTLRAGISCLQAIRGVHDQGLVHRDIKPSNFVTGLPGTPDQATCFIIDFGLARRYRRSNGEIRPPRENAGFRGTSRYASVTSHHHQELGRVDDLWSLLFMLVEFATGTLPWRKYKEKDDIGRCKEESIAPQLVRNLPREFQPFLAHLQTLRYEDEPDYDLLIALMQRSLERRNYPRGKPVDWELDPSMIEAADGEGGAAPAPAVTKPLALNGRNEAEEAAARQAESVRKNHADALGRSSAGGVRLSSSLPPRNSGEGGAPAQVRPVKAGEGGGGATSPRSDGEGEAVQAQQSGNGLRVSEVEMSYQRSALNEESRSTPGRGSQQQQPQQQQPQMAQKVASQSSVAVVAHSSRARREDGSETPAAQVSDVSNVEDDEDDDREFSPREVEETAMRQSRTRPPPHPSHDAAHDGREAGAHDAAAGPIDLAAQQRQSQPAAAAAAAAAQPPTAQSKDRGDSLDVVEQRAANDPDPQGQPRRSQQQSGDQSQPRPQDKTPKAKSNCNCIVM